ncbi:MAG: DUF983 domain-containing protein [Alphaproteobacteria bacterium]|nr:DUF983 domain-containing protein [Alphaproteobacteria bacterium]
MAEAARAPGVAAIALGTRCPRCGKGKLFAGLLKLAPSCTECGLDFSRFDSGDGPAVFVILIAGFLVAGAAVITELMFAPPYWLHLAIWLPLTLIVVIGLLRPLKAGMIALEYRHDAAEGRRVE